MSRAGRINIHGDHRYQHAPDGEQVFVIGSDGKFKRRKSNGWGYGMFTHNDLMRELSSPAMVRCTLMEDGELQIFPIGASEPSSGTTEENEGFISKAAARSVIRNIIRRYTVNKIIFQFYNTGDYDGNVKGGVQVLNRVRYINGNGRYPAKLDV